MVPFNSAGFGNHKLAQALSRKQLHQQIHHVA